MRLDEWRSHGQFFPFESYQIFFKEAGQGEPLLLLHAYPTASWGFHKIWLPLTQHFRVITLDLLGSGFSSKPRGKVYSVARLADIAEALLARLEVNRLHLLAHAYGGTTGQELLARQLHRQQSGSSPGTEAFPKILSACFINSGLFPEGTKPTRTQKLLLTPVGPLLTQLMPAPYRVFCSRLRQNFGPHTQPSEQELATIWQLLTWEEGQRVVPYVLAYLKERERLRDRWVGALQHSPIPLGLINGAADPVAGERVPQIWRSLLPTASCIELSPTIGHYPPLEDPDAVVAAYLAFIAASVGRSGESSTLRT
ncbi:MAG: alpha/beta hydrolase [Synechococcales bacterium]|nr:alpha/beta hydrolase [Synechococcales bacterium]